MTQLGKKPSVRYLKSDFILVERLLIDVATDSEGFDRSALDDDENNLLDKTRLILKIIDKSEKTRARLQSSNKSPDLGVDTCPL
jgi:hypothetical protein